MYFLRHKDAKSDTEEVTIPLEDGGEETFLVERRDGQGLTEELHHVFHGKALEEKARADKAVRSKRTGNYS